MQDTPTGPIFPVVFDEPAIAEDLAHHPPVARLAGCLKTYVPWPTGRFGLVMLPVAHASRPLALRAFAFGVRHPAASKPSVYMIAHERRNADNA